MNWIVKKEKSKGITLIALVITIIVLLILAGVTLAGLTGEKGLIKEARTAKELAELAALEEQVELAIVKAEQKHRNPGIDDVIQEIINNKVISNADQVNKETGAIRTDAGYEITGKLDDYIGKVSVGDGNTTEGGDTPTPPTPSKPSTVEDAKTNGEVLDNTNPTTITDKYENEVVIPEGFKIAEDSGTDVTQGIVIEDVSAGNATTKGSQFVWIPVGKVKYENGSKTIELSRYTFESDGKYTKQGTNTINKYYQELATSTRGNATAFNIETFKTSVNTNHGYYMGRYEAGDSAATDNRTESSNQSNLMVCKEDKFVYNNITQIKASAVSRGMYVNKKFTSDLINSYAWDTAIVFIQEFSGDVDYSRQIRLQSSLAKTGKATDGSNKDVRCNIYDMAGNCGEWTTETSSYVSSYTPNDRPCVYRAGSYDRGEYTSDRGELDTSYRRDDFAFRPILYL